MSMFKYGRKILCMMLIAMLLVSMSGAALAVNMRVYTDQARVYQSASTSSASLALPKGLVVDLTAVNGDWARITYKGRVGYCALAALEATSLYRGYISKNTYVYQSASTSSRRVAVGVNTPLYVIGKWGNFWRVINNSGSAIGFVPVNDVSKSQVAVTPPASYYKQQVIAPNWYGGGSDVLKKNQYGYIYDIASGQFIRIKRMGGSSHADVEPATKEDTAKLLAISGGAFSWDSRACILIANGKYVACAINTMPHGDQTIKNNGFDGQFCLHMVGSKTHGTDAVNSAHQAAIRAAYNWAHS